MHKLIDIHSLNNMRPDVMVYAYDSIPSMTCGMNITNFHSWPVTNPASFLRGGSFGRQRKALNLDITSRHLHSGFGPKDQETNFVPIPASRRSARLYRRVDVSPVDVDPSEC